MASKVVEAFKGLPMAELIGAPLTAVCDAQLKLAEASYVYINRVGFEEDQKTTRLVKFNLERPAETPEGYVKVNTEVQAPLLGLVPIPSLLIEDVVVEFQMEVSSTTASKNTISADASTSVDGGYRSLFSKVSVKVEGKLSSSRENTRNTNQTAKYQVRVNARQQRPTEGLARLMDIMAECTAALPSPKTDTDGGGGGAKK